MRSFALSFLILFFSPIAKAEIFSNSYLSFELPPKWTCELQKTEYICRNNSSLKESREAIIILAAKVKGPVDTLEAYEAYLKTSRSIPSRTGVPLQSQVVKVENNKISDHIWVDGLHLGSEIPNYYTRYLATVKNGVAVLVTFSAHQLYYTKYSNEFFNAIKSLHVTASKDPSGDPTIGTGESGIIGGDLKIPPMEDPNLDAPLEDEEGSGSSSNQLILTLGILIAGAGVYFFLKKNDKKPVKKTRKS